MLYYAGDPPVFHERFSRIPHAIYTLTYDEGLRESLNVDHSENYDGHYTARQSPWLLSSESDGDSGLSFVFFAFFTQPFGYISPMFLSALPGSLLPHYLVEITSYLIAINYASFLKSTFFYPRSHIFAWYLLTWSRRFLASAKLISRQCSI